MKKIFWVGDSLKKLRKFPEPVKDSIGCSLHKIQEGFLTNNVKPLKGFKPAMMEIVSDHDSNTYRTVYTVKLDDVLYVLHCFQKKVKAGHYDT